MAGDGMAGDSTAGEATPGTQAALESLLDVLAVLGQPTPLSTLASILAVSPDALLDPVDPAVTAGALTIDGDGALSIAGGHDGGLAAERLAAMGPIGRARRHADVAAGLLRLPHPPAEAIAHHLVEAAPLVGDRDEARRWCALAAEEAARTHEPDRSARWYAVALSLGPVDHERADLLAALGHQANDAGDLTTAAATFDELAVLARRLVGPSPQGRSPAWYLATAALGASVIAVAAGAGDVRRRLIEEALHGLGPTHPELRVRLLTRLAGALHYTSEVERRDEALTEAARLAAELDDPDAMSHVLSVRSLALWRPEELDRRRDLAVEAERVGMAAGLADFVTEPFRLRVMGLLDAGAIEELDAVLDEHLALCDERGLGVHRWRNAMWRTMRALLTGDHDATEASMERARATAAGLDHPDAGLWFAAQTVQLRRQQGRAEEMVELLQAFVEATPQLHAWRAVLSALLVETGRPDDARGHLDRIVDHLRAERPRRPCFDFLLAHAEGLTAAAFIAEAMAKLGGHRDSQDLYDALAPYAGHAVMVGPAVVYCGSVDHRLAALAGVLGDGEAAAEHLDAARTRYTRMGATPFLTALAADEARRPGVPPQAREALRQLTDREFEVLQEMAAGRSNPEIASRLFMSRKTVMHHAAAIYRKLEVRGRVEAVAMLLRAGDA